MWNDLVARPNPAPGLSGCAQTMRLVTFAYD